MPSKKIISIRGAREHNLKNLDLVIPRDQLVVFTGLSGSGKSSLAFDTIYAEGQRRYIESLSAYARQFIDQLDRPDVDLIEGLSPTISIDQKTVSKNPRSTVGTVTGIYDYLRLLYAKSGTPHCPSCGRSLNAMGVEKMVERAMEFKKGSNLLILSPIVRSRKGIYQKEFDELEAKGFTQVRVDRNFYQLSDEIQLNRNQNHDIEVVVDTLVIRQGSESRLASSIETACSLSKGLILFVVDMEKEFLLSEFFGCAECRITIPEMEPRMFSFNSPHGACENCKGLGIEHNMDPRKIVPDSTKTINEGAILPFAERNNLLSSSLDAFMEILGIPDNIPFEELSEKQKKSLFYGSKGRKIKVIHKTSKRTLRRKREFLGIFEELLVLHEKTSSEKTRSDLENFMSVFPCESCSGGRLKKESLAVTFQQKKLQEMVELPISKLKDFFSKLPESVKDDFIAGRITKEIEGRLGFIDSVGLGYLTLDRSTRTLSGGEGQRIRLASQVGVNLSGVLYILDEPSIGLHPRDNHRLLSTLVNLRDMGNSIIVVEHDRDTIENADYVVDMGPGAGEKGGHIVCVGSPDEIASSDTITGKYLSGRMSIPISKSNEVQKDQFLRIKGASENNLKGIDVSIPLGVLNCVTGVSGSGKSTLVDSILYRALSKIFYNSNLEPGKFDVIDGVENLDKVVNIDQSPIGRTPRSNPATYTGVFTPIREIFSRTTDSLSRGYQSGRFSFNVKGGRCETCEGGGSLKVEMHFLPDIYVKCTDCLGRRFNQETLQIRYKAVSISDVLNMTVREAHDLFENIKVIREKLSTLLDVGLGYIKLGQPATTLSGGEAQRIKLARELSKRGTGKTLYILDEPTTGLHFSDVEKLLAVLRLLVDQGNTVIVIEHNMDVVRFSDNVIDLGPEGGDEGGYLVAEGPPEQISLANDSSTGLLLRSSL
ncbi:MAG: excinuclease ABC subunit UvrA [Nitrospinota bacterium]|nr:excinuclease ABC subunit UvrA [Nitrospinota bacterium]